MQCNYPERSLRPSVSSTPVEILNASLAGLKGLFFMLPLKTFSSSPGYRVLASIAPSGHGACC